MTGIDVADVNRIERLLKYNPTFLDSLFCAEEKEYLALRGNNPETIAEFLSLKEAALKALDAREKRRLLVGRGARFAKRQARACLKGRV